MTAASQRHTQPDARPFTFTYFAPRSPKPPQPLDDRAYAARHAQQTTPTEVVRVADLDGVMSWVSEHATEGGRKGDAGYIVAGECQGERSGDCVGPAPFALIDYDDAAPDWRALDEYEGFAWTTASHTAEHPCWRVVIPFTEPAEHGKLACPFDGGHIRNRSQPAFLPTGTDVEGRALRGTKRLDAAELANPAHPRRERRALASLKRCSVPEGAWGAQIPDLKAIASAVPPAGTPGDRHLLVRGLGGWLARRGYSDDAIAEAVRLQIPSSDPAERAAQAVDAAQRVRAGLDAPGWEALSAWAERFGKRTTLRRLERACRDPREPEGFGDVWSEWWAGYWPRFVESLKRGAANDATHGEVDGTGLHLHPATGWPWILQRNTSYWIHDRDSHSYGGREYAASELTSAVSQTMHGLLDDEATLETLRKEWIRPVLHLRSTYTARAHTYDSATGTLTLAALRWAPLRAQRHPHIDRWLRALFGAGYDAAAQWLASCVALDRPAPCLYLPGPKGLGKSLLASGLAALWSRPAPVDMADAIKDFNQSTGECPLIFTDEGFPERLDFAAFKKAITSHSRSVNAKYRAPVDVEDCGRFMIAANNEDVLRYQRVGTLSRDDLDAIADRLLVVPCRAEAEAEVKRLDTTSAARHEIAEHVLWLAETVALEPSGERMAAKPGGGERILANVVAGRSAEILSRIRETLGTGAMGEKSGVLTTKRAPGEVWINVSRLLATFDGRVTLAAVKEVCDSLQLRPGVEQRNTSDGHNLKWRVLDRAGLDGAFAKLD